MVLGMVEADRVTIADLEIYGLPVQTINGLENCFGFIFVDELSQLTEERLLAARQFGEVAVRQIREALRNFLERRPVKEVKECVAFQKPKRVRIRRDEWDG